MRCCRPALDRIFAALNVARRNDMRDIFDDIYKHNPLDPEELVRRNMRVDLRKRFYEKTSVDESDGAFRVLLDGKPVNNFGTPKISPRRRARWRKTLRMNGMRRRM